MQIENISASSSAAQATASTVPQDTSNGATSSGARSPSSFLSQDTNYSANVGGKTYAAEVNLSAGEYVATVPQFTPPVTVTGSSMLMVESRLNARISLLV